MAAVAVTSLNVSNVPANLKMVWISGTVAGAGTATVPHLLGAIPRGAFAMPNAASGTVTINVADIDDTNVILEISAACNFGVLVLAEAQAFIQLNS